MVHTTFGWKNPSNIDIFGQAWLPELEEEESPKALILLLHGLGEHSSRYEHVADFFTHQKIGIYASDRSGHGKSANRRGHINQYEEVFADINQLRKIAQKEYPDTPIFLYGHSMGGGIAIDYLFNQKSDWLQGVIATSPLLEPAFKPPAFLLFLGKIMRNIYPAFTQDNQLDVEKISRDELVVQAYKADPLVHSKVTSETAIGMLSSGLNSLATARQKSLNIPLLLTHGTADGLTSHKATKLLANNLSGDVTLKLWDGLYHETHNEPEKMEVLSFIYDWILQKL